MAKDDVNPSDPAAITDSRSGGEDERRILRRDPDPHLFRPVQFRSVRARNRIMLSPMCQYSGREGLSNDWHFMHLGARAAGGAGWVFTEAVHVEPRGRITPYCLGLWNDEQRDRLARIAAFVASQDAVPGIQLGHAGRKASVGRPWEGSHPLLPGEGGWTDLVSASALPYARGWATPEAMSVDQIQASLASLKASVRRAREAGFKALELHGAHGYLIHQFLSPLSNRRDDGYGGSFDHRIRFLLESIDATREEWPEELPLFLRLSCTDWVEGGWDLEQTVRLAALLRERGQVDLIDCSSGGNDPRQAIPIHPGYQIPLSQAVRDRAGIATGAVGLIHSPDLAESVVANGQADLVILGRALLADPVWPLRAAAALKARNVAWPKQYERSNIF
ncbi:2,4-dienoyl-CoA reductase-like NADH-dependent reductase (Old Yellow Enzyme family) [Halomonas campaniensis]|uniref:2,4-dienoyl-CoA reductase-like NADH-dependent reductase (Old Yellow Enzyme family) n=1 Tax=Halomonas campaniensis TaxID=213554 RepID=A0A7W5K2S1_9GAMM|nr:NADH:flavin oxidoreductase/NADH oxidase [Halomonas campaniensis]MBB3330898.1 2,4-dienoyl-CoA reductase-like NADH-dependent reductase (Old Yellow Enzyme family) [Halomonas campaniensis]